MQFYNANDLCKLGCNECAGCSDCCHGMGDTILLDPYDIYQLSTVTGLHFKELMDSKIMLTIDHGIILPALTMTSSHNHCAFLNENERCSIHAYRPGLCRLFPLGRDFSSGKLQYFLLEDACTVKNRSKLKIKKWLDIPNLSSYEEMQNTYHKCKADIIAYLQKCDDGEYIKQLNMQHLESLYITPYRTEDDFYTQFYDRLTAFMNQFNDIFKN